MNSAVVSNAPSSARDYSERMVLFCTGLAVFAVFLDTTVGFVTFPAIGRTFHTASPSTVSWVLNAYTLVFGALLIPAGRMADRVGRKKVFLAGVVVFTVGSMACGSAPTVVALIGAEMLEAVGAAMLVPTSMALLLRAFSRERFPVVVAIWGAVTATAGTAGPSLGSLLVSHLSWRWAFFINVPVGIVSFVLARRVLTESKEENATGLPDAASVGLVAVGLAALTFAIVRTNEWGWADRRTIGVMATGATALVWFVLRSRRVVRPVLDLALFRVRDFSWANAAAFAFSVGFNAMFLSNVFFLTRVWHYSIVRAGMAISLGPGIVALTAPRFGRLAARIGQRAVLIPGGLVYASAGLWLLTRASAHPHYLAMYLPASVLSAIGVAMCIPQFSSAAAAKLPSDQFATGSAVVQAVRYIAGSFGVALTIAFTTDHPGLSGFHRVWTVMLVCGLCVFAFASRLARRAPAS